MTILETMLDTVKYLQGDLKHAGSVLREGDAWQYKVVFLRGCVTDYAVEVMRKRVPGSFVAISADKEPHTLIIEWSAWKFGGAE